MTRPQRDIRAFLDRLSAALAEDRIAITDDAMERAGLELSWGIPEIIFLLYMLDADDHSHTTPSTAPEGGVIWVFPPITDDGRLWVRLCERSHIVVVSLHRG